MKVMFDTNVLMAAIGTHGLCEGVVTSGLESHQVFICEQILTELREHLVDKFELAEADAKQVVIWLRQRCEMIQPGQSLTLPIKDRDDVSILAAAVSAQVDCFVTGDRELQELGAVAGIPVFSPRQFYERLK